MDILVYIVIGSLPEITVNVLNKVSWVDSSKA